MYYFLKEVSGCLCGHPQKEPKEKRREKKTKELVLFLILFPLNTRFYFGQSFLTKTKSYYFSLSLSLSLSPSPPLGLLILTQSKLVPTTSIPIREHSHLEEKSRHQTPLGESSPPPVPHHHHADLSHQP